MNRAYSVAGFALSLLLFLSLFLIVANEPFPASSYRHGELVPIRPFGGIGAAVSGFLWEFRGFDLLMQALLLFVTAMCCLAMLREERR
jgi:multisubunit Na+/H+ antiporter MnhB subunit